MQLFHQVTAVPPQYSDNILHLPLVIQCADICYLLCIASRIYQILNYVLRMTAPFCFIFVLALL